MKILVLLGGTSDERDVSLRSGAVVAETLQEAGHEVFSYDPQEDMEALASFVNKVNCVFPILHGAGGEDGTIQTQLEKLGLPYLGSDPSVCKKTFNKVLFKKELDKHHILTPKWEEVDSQTLQKSPLLKGPYVLKPIEGGSSIDTFIVRDPNQPNYNTQDLFKKYRTMLLEELIDGNEITIGVLNSRALPVIEIIPPTGEEFDYENKYNGSTQELCPPKNVPENLQLEAQKLVANLHQLLGARHLSRTDVLIQNGKLFVIDFNTMPGLTDQSLYPKAALAAKITMPKLMQKFVELTSAS